MLSTLCSRLVECVGGVSKQECLQELQIVVPCGAATEVNASYDRCMDQLRGSTCSTLFPTDPSTGERWLALPADCEGIFEVDGDDATGQPVSLGEAIGALMQSEP